MIDINELRRLAQTVQSPAHNINERMDALNTLHNTLPSGVVLELLDRLEEAESDCIEQALLLGMGSSREAALMAKLEAAEKEAAHIKEVEFPRKVRAVAVGLETKCARLEQERDELRAKIETAENDAAHQKALAASALRVAKGWEDKCNALRARIEKMEKQEPLWFIDERGEPKRYHKSKADYCKYGGLDLLYALPGAKGE